MHFGKYVLGQAEQLGETQRQCLPPAGHRRLKNGAQTYFSSSAGTPLQTDRVRSTE